MIFVAFQSWWGIITQPIAWLYELTVGGTLSPSGNAGLLKRRRKKL